MAPTSDDLKKRVAVVVIGRNEARRLPACLEAIDRGVAAIVYVDSGSTDNSVALALGARVVVVKLDDSAPFTAARGRNAGVTKLAELAPNAEFVQFVDGDCVFDPQWLELAAKVLVDRDDAVAVIGRLREAAPEQSIYNRLCDLEWAGVEPGDVRAFGGIVMMRLSSLNAVGGWNPQIIAAEDDELSIRLRASGSVILRLPATMAFHDANLLRFEQWWRRSVRCGHAYAQLSSLHGGSSERYFNHEVRRAFLWGLALPAASVGLLVPTLGLSSAMLGLYPLQVARLAKRHTDAGVPLRDAAQFGTAAVLARFAEVQGMLLFHYNRRINRQTEIIEHTRPG
jgi:glycosyltransferase involved in cell wall biosynthesis